jgi:BirA family biotin operon repressor/biotin-[acetyl-CoA-carboxylase] ligase
MSDPITHEIRRFDLLDSTNDYCFRNADTLSNGTVVMAGYQVQGKGTHGKNWQSNAGENLLFSIYYKAEPFASQPLFSLRIALALTQTLQGLGLSPMIKWPNDILVDEQKIAGILIEVTRSDCVVGIGFNINQQEFPNDVSLPATSLFNLQQQKREPVGVLLKVLDALDHVLAWDDAEVRGEYRKLLYQRGKPCVVNTGQMKLTGIISDIDDEGFLILTDEQGNPIRIHSKAMIEG